MTLLPPLDFPLEQALSGRTRARASIASFVARLIASSPSVDAVGSRWGFRTLRCVLVRSRRWASAVTSYDERDKALAAVRVGHLFADLASAAHHRGPVGDLDDVVHGVRDHDDRPALVAQPADE